MFHLLYNLLAAAFLTLSATHGAAQPQLATDTVDGRHRQDDARLQWSTPDVHAAVCETVSLPDGEDAEAEAEEEDSTHEAHGFARLDDAPGDHALARVRPRFGADTWTSRSLKTGLARAPPLA